MSITYRPIEHWPRKFTQGRRRSPFRAAYHTTIRLLERELAHVRARNVSVQLALLPSQFRLDGQPYAQATPQHPGVIVSFNKGDTPLSFPCDRYQTWIENLRAIALALEALRRVDRYGVTQHAEQYRGWAALPPGTGGATVQQAMTIDEAARFLAMGLSGCVPADLLNRPENVTRAYREKAKQYHPDHNNGVASENWQRLNEARRLLDQHHESRNGAAVHT